MIELWMVYIIISIIAIIIEIFAPSMFCINFTFAGVITAIVSIFWGSVTSTIWLFLGISLLSIFFIRPFLLKFIKKDNTEDFNTQYIGKIVKSIEPINNNNGAVTIYDERWEARVKEGNEEIPADCDVKIVGNDSLVLYVEKV